MNNKILYYINATSVLKVDEIDEQSPVPEILIGETLGDALYGKKYVLLSDNQSDFYNGNPTASIRQIWDMHIPPVTLEQAKAAKLKELQEFDAKPLGDVNIFYINGHPMWLDRDTRVALKNRIDTEEALGKQFTVLWVSGMRLELPIPLARQIILTLEGYSIAAFDRTAEHEATIFTLETNQEVWNYNFRKFEPEHIGGYPEKVHFNLGE
jgi:hypothetical protein